MSDCKPASEETSPNAEVRLLVCDLNSCEARCCYDGVYLEEGEEECIREAVSSEPDLFKQLPDEFIVDGSWEGRVSGRKTATRPYDFKSPSFPAHFSRTRCVFCAEDHKCLLQVLAVERDLHKWTYKPKACWMFPMRIVNGEPAPPPGMDEPDPDCIGDKYPGYSKFVPCGQDRADGLAWDCTLSEEIAFWKKSEQD